jgi:hypothetical protein
LVLKPGAGKFLQLHSGLNHLLTYYVISGLFGLPAYTLQGISVGLHKIFAGDYDGHIKLSRLAQGSEDMETSSNEQKEGVVRAWEKICHLEIKENGAWKGNQKYLP